MSDRSKYGAIPTVVDNVRFASKREAGRYVELKLLQLAGKVCFFECDKKKLRWPLEVNGHLICVYEADFSYYDSNLVSAPRQGMIVEDVKGVRTPAYRLKKKLMKAIHGIEITEV